MNELLIFGLPIIFNPRLLIPFILAPLANILITLTAIQFELMPMPSVEVSFNTPLLLNSWLATNGSAMAPVIQLISILVGVLIYLPFVKRYQRGAPVKKLVIHSLDTAYVRGIEEVLTLPGDSIAEQRMRERRVEQLRQKLMVISDQELLLEYQSQISSSTGEVVGAEALLRMRDHGGHLISPGVFLPVLEQAGLQTAVDLWVAKQLTSDIALFTADMHFEILEQDLVTDPDVLHRTIRQVHADGGKIYIDDFGTGYSSLGYLSRYDIDGAKIDRSFVLGLCTEKGRKLFSAIERMIQGLEMNIVVEGVETEAERLAITNSATTTIQGWYYSKSLPVDLFCEYVRSNQAVSVQAELKKEQ